MWRSVRNALGQAVHGASPQRWRPLLAVYYLCHACDFRCPYCSDGQGQPYHRLPDQRLPGAQVLELLRRVRQHCDYVVLTGGEPTQHEELGAVLAGLPALGFDGVVLTTNGYALEPLLPLVHQAVPFLVFSLDTLDAQRADRCFGRGPGTLARILKTIDVADQTRPAGHGIIISAVATPDNLGDLPGLFAWCRRRGFRFALCPQLKGVHPHPALRDHPEYRAVFELLIAAKRRGADVQGSVDYLEHMRDLRRFDCRPSTVLTVTPTGDVLYPCLELGQVAGNLLEQDLQGIRRQAIERFGVEPRCDNRCQSACALGLSLALGRPWGGAHEAGLAVRRWILERGRGRG